MSIASLGSRAIIGRFFARLEVATGQSWVPLVSMPFTSDQASEEYKWLGQSPVMREWVAGRNPQTLRDNGLIIANKKFEATLDISVDDIRRDKTGQIMIRVDEMADRAVTHDASLLSTLIVAGGSGVCYDGKTFFATDHVEGKNITNQSNDITFDISDNGLGGTATDPTTATMAKAIVKTISQILSFRDDQNEPMNEMAKAFTVMTGTGLMTANLSANLLPMVEAGVSNMIPAMKGKFSINPEVNPRMDSMTSSFVTFRTDAQVKPFIVQNEVPLQISAQAEGSDEEFKNDRHLYGVKKVGNVGYGYWQQACRCTLQA